MTFLQRELADIYEKQGYKATFEYWINKKPEISKMSETNQNFLKDMMRRYIQINSDKEAEKLIMSDNIDILSEKNDFLNATHTLADIKAKERDISEAERLYILSATYSDSIEMYKLGEMFFNGDILAQNYFKAFEWFNKAASKGSVLAKYRLGEMYMQGLGCTKDKEKAIAEYIASNSSKNYSTDGFSIMNIPEGIDKISKHAFENCTSLKSIHIPDSVSIIGDSAFYNCSNLIDVSIDNKHVYIGAKAFDSCPEMSKKSQELIYNLQQYILIYGNEEIRDFYIGRFEVTQELYEKVMGKDLNTSHFKNPQNPVESISIFSAFLFCNKYSELFGLQPYYLFKPLYNSGRVTNEYYIDRAMPYGDGKEYYAFSINYKSNGYRLPTSKEWNYAAISDIHDPWCRENSEGHTHPVGKKMPSRYGLLDVYGNVSEYCLDILNANEYSVKIKGGSYEDLKDFCNDEFIDKFSSKNLGSRTVGFRIVRPYIDNV